MKILIVNADDFGLSRETNLAIEQAHRSGLVRSASLMANMPAFDHALEVLAANPELGVGAHLCLTSGRPVLPPEEVPLLVGRTGRFVRGFFGLWRLLRSRRGRDALAQIGAELAAQLARIESRLGAIDHLNGHQHVHLLPGVFPLVAALARGAKATVRLPLEPPVQRPLGQRWKRLVTGGTFKAALLAHFARMAKARCPEVVHADACLGVGESGRLDDEALAAMLDGLPAGVTELLCHPGAASFDGSCTDCSALDRDFLQSHFRSLELRALCSANARAMLERRGIILDTFRRCAGLPRLAA